MKVILIGDQHSIALGPHSLLKIAQYLKAKDMNSAIGLEMPSMDAYSSFVYTKILDENKDIKPRTPDSPLAEIRLRKLFLDAVRKSFPVFSADSENGKDFETREKAMALNIKNQFTENKSDVVIMMVGTLHLPGLTKQLEQLSIGEVLNFAPNTKSISYFSSVIKHVIANKGFFYSKQNTSNVEARIQAFLDKDRVTATSQFKSG